MLSGLRSARRLASNAWDIAVEGFQRKKIFKKINEDKS